MTEPTTSWLMEHAAKLYTAGAAIAGATAAWVTMRVKVQILGDRFDAYIERDERMHTAINERMDRHESLLAEQSTSTRLLQRDIQHLSGKLDHFLDDHAAMERAERFAAIQIEALRKAGVLKPPEQQDDREARQ